MDIFPLRGEVCVCADDAELIDHGSQDKRGLDRSLKLCRERNNIRKHALPTSDLRYCDECAHDPIYTDRSRKRIDNIALGLDPVVASKLYKVFEFFDGLKLAM